MLGKLATPSPMEQMSQLSTTGHPYWIEASKCARPVDIHLISESQELQTEIRRLFPGYSPALNNCFENSFSLAAKLEEVGVCYVEGLNFSNERINLHAWISFHGQSFDPTLEHGYALPEYRSEQDWREDAQYIALIEMPPSQICSKTGFDGYFSFVGEDAQIVPPLSRHIWGIPEVYEDQFAIKGAVFQLLMMQFSDPDSQPSLPVNRSRISDNILMEFERSQAND